MSRHISKSKSKALYLYKNAAAVGIQKLSLSAAQLRTSATRASCTDSEEISEGEDWYASHIIQDKDLLRKSLHNSGTGLHVLDLDALVLFPQMLLRGLEPNQFTLSSLFKAAGAVSDDNNKHGRQLHAYCLKYGFDTNVYVGTSLVDMYARLKESMLSGCSGRCSGKDLNPHISLILASLLPVPVQGLWSKASGFTPT
ncbi:hypothetical protein GBA52_022028 [Prunus armeniaca]|nr:hypothetical protein GBA52_022028 [Prunus armeniaca]